MYQGYLSFGCTEIANAQRAQQQAVSAGCPIWWLEEDDCGTLADALNGGIQYDQDSVSSSPWYDSDDPVSGRFLGVYPARIEGIENSTRTGTLVEGIANGGDISGTRNAIKTVRVVAELIGYGQDALEYGLTWLSAALESDLCSTHDGTCGESDLTFFAHCPPRLRANADPDEYDDAVNDATRMLHGVKTISGPTIMERHERPHHGEYGAYGYLVEFVFACSNPFVFSLPKRVQSPATAGVVIQDIPYNLAKYPGAEIASESFVVAQNFSTNPSLETNANTWALAPLTGDISGYVTSGRSDDLAVRGGWSYRARLLGSNGTASPTATWAINHTVALPTAVTGERFSFTVWAAALAVTQPTGTSINSVRVQAIWNDPLNTVTEIGTSTMSADFNGKVYSIKSVQRPTGATSVILSITAQVTWASGASSDVRLYADTAAVTKP